MAVHFSPVYRIWVGPGENDFDIYYFKTHADNAHDIIESTDRSFLTSV